MLYEGAVIVSGSGSAMRSLSKTATSSRWPPMASMTLRQVDKRLSSADSIAEIDAWVRSSVCAIRIVWAFDGGGIVRGCTDCVRSARF